jgi:hypothetical protein
MNRRSSVKYFCTRRWSADTCIPTLERGNENKTSLKSMALMLERGNEKIYFLVSWC